MDTAASPTPSRDEPDTAENPLRNEPDTVEISSIGGPVWVAWREGTLTRAEELEALCAWVRAKDLRRDDEVLANAIRRHLEAARQAARAEKLKPQRRFRIFRNGPLIERAMSNLDAAEAQLLNLAPAATYLVKCLACSGTCSVISLRLTRLDRSSSGSPEGLVSRIRITHCSRTPRVKI